MAPPPPARALVALLVVALLLGGCSWLPGSDDDADGAAPDSGPRAPLTAWDRADADQVADGGTLRLAVASLPASLNPEHADAVGSELDRLLGPTRGGVVRLTDDGGWEVDPDHAESVEVVREDPLTVRVALHPDAVWQGGSPITSDDMVATWRALSGADARLRVGSTEGWDDVAAVRPRGRTGYDVVFARPRADWASFVSPELPASVARSPRRFNDGFDDRAVPSNGPFVVTSVDRESGTVTQERNPRWWGREPRVERLVWRVATPDVQAEAFAADELDVAVLDPSAFADGTLEGVDDDRVQRASGSQWSHLTLNAGSGPLRQVEVRRAIALAVDRQALAEASARQVGTPVRLVDSLLLVPGQVGYETVAEPRRRDLDRARALLADAGFGPDDEPLALDLPVPAGDPGLTARARAVAADLEEAGIEVALREVEVDAFADEVLVPFDFDLVTFSWGASLLGPGPAEGRFRPITSPENLTGRSSGDPDLWRAAVGALDADRLAEATARLDGSLRRAAVVVPLHVVPSVVAVGADVVNVGASTFAQPDWTVVGLRTAD